jgi:hypothetical protein
MWNIAEKRFRGNKNTHFVFSNFFCFPKSCCLWDNVEKYCRAGQAGSLLRYTYIAGLVKYLIAQSTSVKDLHSVMLGSLLPHTFLWSRLSHCIEYRPSLELNIRCDTQEIPLRFYFPAVPYCIPDSPPLAFILNQINPVHILSPYYFKIHFNNISYLRLDLPGSSFSSGLGGRNFTWIYDPCDAPPPIPLNRIKSKDWKREGCVPSCGVWHEVHQVAWKSFCWFERQW